MALTLPDPERLVDELARQLTAQLSSDVLTNMGIVGIYTGGVLLAERLHAAIKPRTGLGTLATTFYRDDFDKRGLHRERRPTHLPFEIDDRDILLVDDVLYTGRTIRAAVNEIFDFGRPRSIRLAVLLDRGGRELPIAADFVGATLPLPATEMFVLKHLDNRFVLATKPRESRQSRGGDLQHG
jgi:pyrimidine operon attenuation protein / uracil phosphoribosyltransferase